MKIQTRDSVRPTLVKLGVSRQVVIPKKIHDELRLAPGDYFEIARKGNQVVLTPKAMIEKRIAEGLEDIRRGRVYGPFSSAEELIRSLHREAKKLRKR